MTTNTNIHTLSHTSWNCKYHIVFAPKYRRKQGIRDIGVYLISLIPMFAKGKVFYNEKRQDIGSILRSLCKWKTRVRCYQMKVYFHLIITHTRSLLKERSKSSRRRSMS